MEAVSDPSTQGAIDALAAAVDALESVGVTPVDAAHARAVVGGLETVARRVRSLQVELVAEIDRTGVYRADGHASAKVMVRHVADLSPAEAARRARCARAVRSLPAVRAAFAAGRIGGCQVERIARAHGNPRVRRAVEANEASFAAEAEANEYLAFDRMVDEWVRMVDEDGARDRDQSAHEQRDARLHQSFDGSWEITGRCGSLAGVELRSIFDAYLKGSDSVVIDLGRRRRLFTGAAALAVKLSSTTCYWPGCHVPVTECQGDHLTPWSTGGGSTNPRNGGPACGRHNRLRNHGYRTWRDPTGTWHTTRPDGAEIT